MSLFRIFSGYPFSKGKVIAGSVATLVLAGLSLFLTFQVKTNFRMSYLWSPNSRGYEFYVPYIILFFLLASLLLLIFTTHAKSALSALIIAGIALCFLILLRAEIHSQFGIDHDYDTKTGPGVYAFTAMCVLFTFYSIANFVHKYTSQKRN